MTPIKLIVGLGNPGAEHEDNRHNVGFWFVDRLCAQLRVDLRHERKFHGQTARSVVQPGRELWLLKPSTYMNRSGLAVVALSLYYKILPSEILVVYDELDLLPGVARLKQAGGAGGHNGIKDIMAHLTTADFWRLRIGIGHPGDKDLVSDYVLHAPSKLDRESIDAIIERALHVFPLILKGEVAAAMLQLHTKPKAAASDDVKREN
jgi:peptidyl-tRNA hydrolase, PTH1 family